MKDLRVVIPAYNEEASISEVVGRVKRACQDAEIIVVNDASKDRTAEIAKYAGAELINNSRNYGKGGATKIGCRYNFHEGIKYLAFIDADGTYPPESFKELYNLCKHNGVDLAVGSRFLGKNEGMPFIRKVGNKIFAIMLSIYTGKHTTDTSTGMRLFQSRLLPLFDSLPDGLDFDTSMTALALFEGLKYAEVPIEYRERRGRSKLSVVRDGYRFLRTIMRATRKYKPIKFYCTLGLPFLIIDYFLILLRIKI